LAAAAYRTYLETDRSVPDVEAVDALVDEYERLAPLETSAGENQ